VLAIAIALSPLLVQVLQRGQQAGVCALVAYTTDFDKADMLVRCAKENAGLVYCCVGVHSDNIKRSNEK
jgi:Tat protein secretion system quality control protein TatD with DNase activity